MTGVALRQIAATIAGGYTIFNSEEEARSVADPLNEGDQDGWTYKVSVDPKGSGRAFIIIYDEDGDFVANL